MARAIWKGAISFGLVHIPVALVSATSSQGGISTGSTAAAWTRWATSVSTRSPARKSPRNTSSKVCNTKRVGMWSSAKRKSSRHTRCPLRPSTSFPLSTANRFPCKTSIRPTTSRRIDWKPEDYRDSFEDKIMALVEKKANEGKIEDVETAAGEEERKTADVIDLTELLNRSLGGKSGGKTKPANKPTAHKKATKTSRG